MPPILAARGEWRPSAPSCTRLTGRRTLGTERLSDCLNFPVPTGGVELQLGAGREMIQSSQSDGRSPTTCLPRLFALQCPLTGQLPIPFGLATWHDIGAQASRPNPDHHGRATVAALGTRGTYNRMNICSAISLKREAE